MDNILLKMKYGSLLLFALCLSCQHQSKPKIEPKLQEKVLTNKAIGRAIVEEENIKIDSIGILVYDGFLELDAIGPYSVLSSMIGTNVFFVAEKEGVTKSSSGLEMMVSNCIDDIKHLDILLIPGGTTGTVNASKNPNIINWIKKIDSSTTFTSSVCTGAWILGEAGLLKNKKATTNWYRAEEKIQSYNGTFINERYVRDGKLWTSAGVSAGIDMSLAMVNEIKGETYTKLIMLNLEYDPKPPFAGGSVENTNRGLVEHMSEMYDATLKKD